MKLTRIEGLKPYKPLLWLLLFGGVTLGYFLTSFFMEDPHIVHLPMDDLIPFVPCFILPYVSWYLYVPGLMILTFFEDEGCYKKQVAALFSGAFLCLLFFIVYPTAVDFRPPAGNGFFGWICGLVFSADPPQNVFPSLHCFEAVLVHLIGFQSAAMKRHKVWRIASAVVMVLICASTVFVKQHSIADVIGGCVLAAAMAVSAQLVEKGRC